MTSMKELARSIENNDVISLETEIDNMCFTMNSKTLNLFLQHYAGDHYEDYALNEALDDNVVAVDCYVKMLLNGNFVCSGFYPVMFILNPLTGALIFNEEENNL